jgi:hypothetical protein
VAPSDWLLLVGLAPSLPLPVRAWPLPAWPTQRSQVTRLAPCPPALPQARGCWPSRTPSPTLASPRSTAGGPRATPASPRPGSTWSARPGASPRCELAACARVRDWGLGRGRGRPRRVCPHPCCGGLALLSPCPVARPLLSSQPTCPSLPLLQQPGQPAGGGRAPAQAAPAAGPDHPEP